MAGIYLHIPFCKKACHYCDFHFSTSLQHKERLLQAMHREIELRAKLLTEVNTIYFGGGTPSLLSDVELSELLHSLKQHFNLSSDVQVTLEANPDDLSREKLLSLKSVGVERLSIGIQSFFDEDLEWMNRSHKAAQALQCIQDATDIGFKELNIDLIFGYPLLSDDKWEANIKQALSLPIHHLSCYSMTVEDKTALSYQIEKGQTAPMEDGQAARQYIKLMEEMKSAGWEHYEISNFCKPGFRSKHNTSYWQSENYIGIGPSAHGYLHPERYWNIANNAKYMDLLFRSELAEEKEYLSDDDLYNEYLMTRLRTAEGITKPDLEQRFGSAAWNGLTRELEQYSAELGPDIFTAAFHLTGDSLKLTQRGKLLADTHISALFRA